MSSEQGTEPIGGQLPLVGKDIPNRYFTVFLLSLGELVLISCPGFLV